MHVHLHATQRRLPHSIIYFKRNRLRLCASESVVVLGADWDVVCQPISANGRIDACSRTCWSAVDNVDDFIQRPDRVVKLVKHVDFMNSYSCVLLLRSVCVLIPNKTTHRVCVRVSKLIQFSFACGCSKSICVVVCTLCAFLFNYLCACAASLDWIIISMWWQERWPAHG